MINKLFLNSKPLSQDFFVFLERNYPDYYNNAVQKDFDEIPGSIWSEFWSSMYSGELDNIHFPVM